jgi:hypothetical protein
MLNNSNRKGEQVKQTIITIYFVSIIKNFGCQNFFIT